MSARCTDRRVIWTGIPTEALVRPDHGLVSKRNTWAPISPRMPTEAPNLGVKSLRHAICVPIEGSITQRSSRVKKADRKTALATRLAGNARSSRNSAIGATVSAPSRTIPAPTKPPHPIGADCSATGGSGRTRVSGGCLSDTLLSSPERVEGSFSAPCKTAFAASTISRITVLSQRRPILTMRRRTLSAAAALTTNWGPAARKVSKTS